MDEGSFIPGVETVTQALTGLGSSGRGNGPLVPLGHLDDLWFQVGGTLCNLECKHCFISCSPHNRSFGFLTLTDVRAALEESVRFGVKEYYFTGGEPFLNPELVDILELTLQYGPATVLTNATVFREEWLTRLRQAEGRSSFSLEFRVSIDGFCAADNDPVRGPGTFDRAMQGVRQLVRHGFLPIITVTRVREKESDEQLVEGFVNALKSAGYERPRLKILPVLRIGAEACRGRAYGNDERVTPEMLKDFDQDQLICNHSRVVTDRGIFVCPILIEAPDARLGSSLSEALNAYPLRHQACYTCYQYGTICSNASSGRHNA